MTSRARRPCLECGTPTTGTYCPTHGGTTSTQLDAARRAKQSAHGRNTAHWKSLRLVVLTRDGYRCRLQHRGCTGTATSVHLDPNAGGLHAVALASDCLSACRHCHGVEDGRRTSEYRA